MTNRDSVIRLYSRALQEDLRAARGNTLYINYGYHDGGTADTDAAACARLVDHALGLVESREGRVLEVGCGVGGCARQIAEAFGEEGYTGINIDPAQVEEARTHYPNLCFIEMDACHLRFEPCAFDAILCIEAAFHFDTRQDFFVEAERVLKPNGKIILLDILFKSKVGLDEAWPQANIVESLDQYRTQLQTAGFDRGSITIENITEQTALPYLTKLYERHGNTVADFVLSRLFNILAYVRVSARRPALAACRT